MYNSAGSFSTFVEKFFPEGRLCSAESSGAFGPLLRRTSLRRGLRPLLGPVFFFFFFFFFFPGRACQRYNTYIHIYLIISGFLFVVCVSRTIFGNREGAHVQIEQEKHGNKVTRLNMACTQ